MEQGIWTREFLISPELCGMDGRLGVLGGLTLFRALAAEHAEQIGVGFAAMARRREFWLTVHCRIELLRPLALMDTVTGETWPEACRAESVRCFRSYRLRRGDEVFAVGRTEWAILGGAGKVVPFGQSGFPQDFPFPAMAAIEQKPRRFVDDFTEPGEAYPVRATDIDVGRHVNNLAYVRATLGCCLPRGRNAPPQPVRRRRGNAPRREKGERQGRSPRGAHVPDMSIKLYWRQATLPDEATLARLSPQRRDRVLRCHNSETAAGIAAAGLLLAEYVADEEALLRTPEGKPYLPGGPEFSLSHGGSLAALLISDTPCGVDVECADRAVSERIRERVFQRIFQREEADSERALSWLWTRKEAVMKLDGRGLGLDPRCFSVLAARTQLSGRKIALATQIVRGHFISIAYDLSGKG